MPKDAVRYEPDKDEEIYTKRKNMYIGLGYEAHEEIGTIGKVCTLSKKVGTIMQRVILTFIKEEN